MTDMRERRQFVRLDTRIEASFRVLPAGGAQGALTKNLSGDGICLFADRPIAPGTLMHITLKLPAQVQPLVFAAKVIWSESYEVIGKTEHQRAVEIGVQFVDILPKDREDIMRHVILSLGPPHV